MNDPPPHFTLRLKPRASRDWDAIIAETAEQEGDVIAAKWIAALDRVFGSLATNPRRYAIPTDAVGFAGEVRAVTFRRAEGTAPYRLIYRVTESPDDGSLVELLHIRHAAARPIKKREAREIEAQNQ